MTSSFLFVFKSFYFLRKMSGCFLYCLFHFRLFAAINVRMFLSLLIVLFLRPSIILLQSIQVQACHGCINHDIVGPRWPRALTYQLELPPMHADLSVTVHSGQGAFLPFLLLQWVAKTALWCQLYGVSSDETPSCFRD